MQVILYAQARGNSQGVIKITSGAMAPAAAAAADVEITKDTRISALLHGHGRPGMVVLKQAMNLAAEKAREHGVGIVGAHGTASSTGCLAYYAEQLSQQGLVGMVLAQSPEYVAPAGARVDHVSRSALLSP
jgi:LDH2 family malate/lactate/ureidoglycolate dehydrogenase